MAACNCQTAAWKEGAGVLALSWVLAFTVGAIACRLLEWMPIL
ncbi:MAG: hypothetical protein NTW61_02480 [Candidatus Melainabacteria bacterium]|nr:hypothetical protein [Candidatus Melainabacteria bacterium]